MADTPSAENSPAKPMESKRIRYFELCLVLLVALSTPFLNSVLLLVRGPSALGQISSFRWINGSLHEIIALALLGYVLARRGRRFRDLGLRWSARDCGVGLIVAVVSYISYLAVGIVLQSIHFALVGDIATRNSSQAFFWAPRLAGGAVQLAESVLRRADCACLFDGGDLGTHGVFSPGDRRQRPGANLVSPLLRMVRCDLSRVPIPGVRFVLRALSTRTSGNRGARSLGSDWSDPAWVEESRFDCRHTHPALKRKNSGRLLESPLRSVPASGPRDRH
jgi:hypothetical protein